MEPGDHPTLPNHALPAPQSGGRILLVIHGELYDLTDFITHHPGGTLPIQLANDLDATELFEAYHPGSRAREILRLYRVSPGTEPVPAPTPFTAAVQSRVAEYFTHSGIDPKASWGQSLWYTLVVGLYLGFLCGYWLGSWLALVCLAGTSWFVFGMGHDGAHFAVSRRSWVNRLASLGLLTNMNVLVWYFHHTLGHHVRTNCPDDPDHHVAYPFVRTSQARPHRWWHRWQSVLLPFYFLLPTGLMTLVGPPLWLASRHAVGIVPMQYPGLRWWGGLSWALTAGALVIVPLSTQPLGQAIAFPFIYLMLTGLIFSLNVFASHLSPECATQPTGTDWAKAQAGGSINWRSGNWLASWFSVGVNHQIEHHLFPGVNPEHYHRLSPIVQEVCREYGVEYQSHRTFIGFIVGSFRWIRLMSRPPSTPP